MSSASGLPAYQIKPVHKFERSYKELLKRHYKKSKKAQQLFQSKINQIVKDLSDDPFLLNSKSEPIPGKLNKLEEWEFRKYYFKMPNLQGASGQGRLIYLVNKNERMILLVWIYTHEEFAKRPPDNILKQILQDTLDSNETQENIVISDETESNSEQSNSNF
ncbi:MAG: hypothetical protein SAJ37_15890 [Oscillatoria sp. PMC 1068.18]|nr:hypothetical protein [Oscillatoria sp. PMC 1076.18]MEC4990214.1 hypothetical protein [Oscillatoria sp. PMC 1068.18]